EVSAEITDGDVGGLSLLEVDVVRKVRPDAILVLVTIRGTRINPLRLRVTESDWPITRGYTVAHRNKDGVWTDLTDYVHFEETQTSNITIGDFSRDLNAAGSVISDRAGAIIPPNNTIPGAPTWVTGSFQTTNYADSN